MREPETARTQMARVLSSSIFCDSPTQQKLLRYLIEHMADGQGGDLKEYTIGAAVFRRGPDFDPRTDSIVRVQVGVLRKKLAAYYAGPGSEDGVVIDIPRGHYLPQILTREIPPAAELKTVVSP